jgi:molybdopterin adenylyltransferase
VRTVTPLACLSRSVIGIIGQSMVVCLPGKPKAVKENFEILTAKGVL